MKHLLVTVLSFAFLMSSFVIYAQETPVQQFYGVEQQQLIDLSVELMDAVERKDKETLERLVAEDFIVTSPGDVTEVKRNEWIANSISMNWENPKFHNFRVNVNGDTAVVTSLFNFKVSGGKVPIPIITNTQIVDVWTKRGGQWQIAARHLGAYSIGGYLRLAAGFIAGLVFSSVVWLLARIKRRSSARKKLEAA